MVGLKLALPGYIAAAALLWLWLGARDDLAMQISQCNADKLSSIAEASELARTTEKAAAAVREAELARQAQKAQRARDIAQEGHERAIVSTAKREQEIRRLTLEADISEIPDSKECLTVFVPESSIRSLRTRENCGKASNRGNTWTDGVCTGAEGFNGTDYASGYFSNITYGDALTLWGRDRDSIEIHNADKLAIDSLDSEDL